MDADRNFLFGLAAVQSGLIDEAQLVLAGVEWLSRRQLPFVDVMVEKGWISGDERSTLEARVRDLERSTLDAGFTTLPPGSSAIADGFSGQPNADDSSTFALPTSGGKKSTNSHHRVDSNDVFGPRYVKAKVHATGGIGRVWHVTDTVLGRAVALKEVRPDRKHLANIDERFLEEARITSQLEHPNIIPVHDLMEWTHRQYYTMRFLGDDTLIAAIRQYHEKHEGKDRPEVKLRRLLDAFVSVCNAIAFAHSKGVIHRDIKGQNVCLGEYGEVIVLDWGLAKRLDAADDPLAELASNFAMNPDCSIGGTEPGQAIGTPNYMPPEQAAGDRERIGKRSDVFGLGAMLYVILTGRPPYEGGGCAEVIQKAIECKPKRPRAVNSAVPVALESICLKAMQPKLDDRYASALELAKDVSNWLADEPISVHKESPVEKVGRWSRRHRTLVASAVVLLAATAVGLGIGGVLLSRAKDRTELALIQSKSNVATMQVFMEEMVDEVFGPKLPFIPEADELRSNFARHLLSFYPKVLSINGDDPKLISAAAKGYRRAGSAFRSSRELQQALDAHNKAVLLLNRRTRPEDRNLLANARIDMATVLQLMGKFADSRTELLNANKVADALTSEDAANENHARLKARCLANLGHLDRSTGDYASAHANFDTSYGLLRPIVDGKTSTSNDAFEIVNLLIDRARALREDHQPERAKPLIVEAIRRGKAMERHPWANRDHRFLTAAAMEEYAHLLSLDPSQASAAETILTDEIDRVRKLVHDYGDFHRYQEALGVALDLRSTVRLQLQPPKRAEADEDGRNALAAFNSVLAKAANEGLQGDLGRAEAHYGLLALARDDRGAAEAHLQRAVKSLQRAVVFNKQNRVDAADLARFQTELARVAASPGK